MIVYCVMRIRQTSGPAGPAGRRRAARLGLVCRLSRTCDGGNVDSGQRPSTVAEARRVVCGSVEASGSVDARCACRHLDITVCCPGARLDEAVKLQLKLVNGLLQISQKEGIQHSVEHDRLLLHGLIASTRDPLERRTGYLLFKRQHRLLWSDLVCHTSQQKGGYKHCLRCLNVQPLQFV